MKPIGYRRAWHERRFFRAGRSSNGAEGPSPDRQCHAFRLETRARELAVMASLNLKRWRRRETEFSQHCEEKRVKVRRVMAVRLEASRSIPEQDEGGRKPTGGLKQY